MASKFIEKADLILNMRLKSLIDLIAGLVVLGGRGEGSGKKSKGRGLHPYVSGLIFTATLLEEIQQDVPKNLTASWGQVVGENGEFSNEIDTIIYDGKPIYEWKNINYAIVPKNQVKAVFEIKQWDGTKALEKYREDYDTLKEYSPKKYLLFGYSTAKTIPEKEQKLKTFGFDDVFYLSYSHGDWHQENWYHEPCYESWRRLIQILRTL